MWQKYLQTSTWGLCVKTVKVAIYRSKFHLFKGNSLLGEIVDKRWEGKRGGGGVGAYGMTWCRRCSPFKVLEPQSTICQGHTVCLQLFMHATFHDSLAADSIKSSSCRATALLQGLTECWWMMDAFISKRSCCQLHCWRLSARSILMAIFA